MSQQVFTLGNPTATKPPEGAARVRNADATKAAILDAARQMFSQRGFDSAGSRDIAALAGCNVALINRYFGSKENLFRTVMEQCIDLSALATCPVQDLPAAIADLALGKAEDKDGFDPMYAGLRSSSSDVAKRITREQLGEPMVAELAGYIKGDGAKTKAAMILCIVAGFDVGRNLIGPVALDRSNDAALRPLLEATVRAILQADPGAV